MCELTLLYQVLILRTEAAVESFTRPRVTLGGEMSIAAGSSNADHRANEELKPQVVQDLSGTDSRSKVERTWHRCGRTSRARDCSRACRSTARSSSNGMMRMRTSCRILLSVVTDCCVRRRSYGVLVTAAEILDGDVRPPYWCEGLHETIRAAEGTSSALPPHTPLTRPVHRQGLPQIGRAHV